MDNSRLAPADFQRSLHAVSLLDARTDPPRIKDAGAVLLRVFCQFAEYVAIRRFCRAAKLDTD